MSNANEDEITNEVVVALEVSLFKLDIVSQEGELVEYSGLCSHIDGAWDFYTNLYQYWELFNAQQ